MTSIASTHFNFAQHDSQTQSPLFSVLPGEIRNEIFALALVQYEDDEAAYPKDSYWYRPGFAGPRKSSSALLRTCKLAYLEGYKVFLSEIEWAFWFDRGPQGRSGSPACISFFRNLSAQNAQDLQKVRFFTQMYWLENGFGLNSIFRQPNFRPTTLTITIRYSDWWFWESNTPLRMSEDWLRRFKGPSSLKELRVEYETLNWKKEQMMKIVERNKKWKMALQDEDGYLSAEGTKLVEWKWTGPSKLDGRDWAHHGPGETVEYIVVTDTWRYVEGRMSEEDAARRFEDADGDSQRSFSDDEFFGVEDGNESLDSSEYQEDNEGSQEGSGVEQSERGLENESFEAADITTEEPW